MELRQLRCFVTLCEDLHFGRAAERLRMAQSALSQTIRSLEDELGVRLFFRTTRQVSPTRAGTLFLEEARQLLDRAEQAVQLVKLASGTRTEILRIGGVDSATAGFLPSIIRSFRNLHPDVDIRLSEMGTAHQLHALDQGKIDLGFLRPPFDNDDTLEGELLLAEELVLAVPADHRLARADKLSLECLAKEPLILCPRHVRPCLHDIITHHFRAAGLVPRLGQEAAEKHTIINMVAAGVGISLVPEWVTRMRIDGLAYRRLGTSAPKVGLGVVWQRQSRPAVVDEFLSLVRQSTRPDCRAA